MSHALLVSAVRHVLTACPVISNAVEKRDMRGSMQACAAMRRVPADVITMAIAPSSHAGVSGSSMGRATASTPRKFEAAPMTLLALTVLSRKGRKQVNMTSSTQHMAMCAVALYCPSSQFLLMAWKIFLASIHEHTNRNLSVYALRRDRVVVLVCLHHVALVVTFRYLSYWLCAEGERLC